MTAPATLEAIAALETAKSLMMGGGTWTNAAGYTTDAALWIDRALSALREGGIGEGGLTAEHPSSPPNGDLEGWRLIESAPRDGSLFVVLGHWSDGTYWRNLGHRASNGLLLGDWDPETEPTHWMPLPEPPASVSPLEGEDVVSRPSGRPQNPSPPLPQREG